MTNNQKICGRHVLSAIFAPQCKTLQAKYNLPACSIIKFRCCCNRSLKRSHFILFVLSFKPTFPCKQLSEYSQGQHNLRHYSSTKTRSKIKAYMEECLSFFSCIKRVIKQLLSQHCSPHRYNHEQQIWNGNVCCCPHEPVQQNLMD